MKVRNFDMIHGSIPRPEHPNPEWERASFVNLNGEWEFEIDSASSGIDRALHTKEHLSGKITLPFCPESPLSGVGNRDFMAAVWYKRSIKITAEELEGKRVILHFGAADYETRLWVNGKSVGMPHFGGYTPFSYDITDFLSTGENILTVLCCDDTRSPKQPSGKQSEAYDSYGCFYTRTTGIWQTVFYEIVPENRLKRARFYPDAENGTLTVVAETLGVGDLSASVFYEGRLVGEARKANLSGSGTLEIALSETHLWELGFGRLYDVVLRFGEDEVKSYFGLRSIALSGRKFLLNGKSVFQRLVLDQGFYADGIYTAPTEEALVRDIQCAMAAGFNGARLHEKVFEPRYLYHADRLGFMVWGEYPSWGYDHSDIGNLYTFLPEWLDSVTRDFNHPSVIGWCPFNETWDVGAQKKRVDPALLRIVYEETKRCDPTRPCIDTSGNFHAVTDIYDVHDYGQDPAAFRARYNEAYLSGTVEENHHCIGRQSWDGKLPLFVSEYGGIGFSLEKEGSAWSYGQAAATVEEFYERYRGLTHALLDNPSVMGFCYTQLTNVEQEQNGLYTYADRTPKFDISVIAEINRKRAAIEEE